MDILVIILIIIIVFLLCYLFLYNKELKRIKKELNMIFESNTNSLIHTEFISNEIQELVSTINVYLNDLKSKKIAIERKNNKLMIMMRNISHDLRTPLTSASGYIDMMLKSDISEKEKIKEMKIIQSRLKRLTELVNSFFEFSKIITSDNNLELGRYNIIGILEESIGAFYEDYKKDRRKIDLITKNSKIEIYTNKTMLARVFENLISNALKYGKGNLNIEIKNQENLKILFSNEIEENNIDTSKIFDEFYTTDISRTKGSTGLGLAIAKEFVEQLGGIINANIKDNNLIIEMRFNISKSNVHPNLDRYIIRL